VVDIDSMSELYYYKETAGTKLPSKNCKKSGKVTSYSLMSGVEFSLLF
jgi:hypothetical protein